MVEYQNVLSSLGISDAIRKCATGEIFVPIIGVEAPAYWYGFPPALIPIWSQGARPKYVGVWKHWFSDRKPSYVEMFVASGRLTIEIARTSEQLFCFTTIAAIVEQDGVSSEIEDFCGLVGVENLDEIDIVTLEAGDNPLAFGRLAQFKDELPLHSTSDATHYTGDFPAITQAGEISNLKSCFEFEIDEALLKVISSGGCGTPWLSGNESRQEWFYRSLAEGNKSEAWQALNCKGWSIAEARVAIERLAEYACDASFDSLASAWLSVADPSVGGY